jgi:hypothetical protein
LTFNIANPVFLNILLKLFSFFFCSYAKTFFLSSRHIPQCGRTIVAYMRGRWTKRSLIIQKKNQIRCLLHHRRYWIKVFLYMYIFLQNVSSLSRHNFLMRARHSIPRLSTVMNSSSFFFSCLLLCMCVYARFFSSFFFFLVVSVGI